MEKTEWTHILVQLLALASRLEGEGQHNVVAISLSRLDANEELLATLLKGASAIAEGQLIRPVSADPPAGFISMVG